jgi:tetraacyldisaccharide 4'-kinase
VIVGEDRYSAGLHAEREGGKTVLSPMHLLDDGFQHRQLHRDFDIVLLNREDLDDRLIPSGRLRESLASLNRADAIVADREFPESVVPTGHFQVWRIERKMDIPELNGPVIAFCGIARPQRFFSALRSAGIDLHDEITFRDHHRYSAANVKQLLKARTEIPGSILVTTEKDAINLGTHLGEIQPVVIPMRIELVDSENALKYLRGTLAERSMCPS